LIIRYKTAGCNHPLGRLNNRRLSLYGFFVCLVYFAIVELAEAGLDVAGMVEAVLAGIEVGMVRGF